MAHIDTSRPEPVLEAARLAGLVSAVVVAVGGALVLLGVATLEDVTAWSVAAGGIVTAAVALVAYVAPVWQARKAREAVTPLSSPRDSDGLPFRAPYDNGDRGAIGVGEAVVIAVLVLLVLLIVGVL